MKRLLSILSVTLCLFSLVLVQCKKSGNKPNAVVNDSTLVLQSNVYVIDSQQIVLTTDSAKLSQGVYNFTSSSSLPNFKTGDVIVGATNGGYIRVIQQVTSQTSGVTLMTTQGTMEDVFAQGKFSFDVNSDNLIESNSYKGNIQSQKKVADGPQVTGGTSPGDGLSVTLNNTIVYQDGSTTISLKSAGLQLNPDWDFAFKFDRSGISLFDVGFQNATFTSNIDVNVTCAQVVNLVSGSKILKDYSKSFVEFVEVGLLPVPVVIQMDISILANYSGSISAQANRDFLYSSTGNLSLEAKYSAGSWQNNYSYTPTTSVSSLTQTTGQAKFNLNISLVPKISLKLYRIAGPYFSAAPNIQIVGNIASPALDWDFTAGAWIESTLGAKVDILGKTIAELTPKIWETDTVSYITPATINKVSGDNQTGASGAYLAQPLLVSVLDNLGKPQSGVPVYFSVTAGGGTVETPSVLTDNNGNAQTRWQLGNQFGIQTVAATAKKANGTAIANAPIDFAAANGSLQSVTVITTAVSAITGTSAISGGTVTNSGTSALQDKGICYNTSGNPTTSSSSTISDGNLSGSYISVLANLAVNTTYFIRAYAIDSLGNTYYGDQQTFTTAATDPYTTLNGTYNVDSSCGNGSCFAISGTEFFTLKLIINNGQVTGLFLGRAAWEKWVPVSGSLSDLIIDENDGNDTNPAHYFIEKRWEFKGTFSGGVYSGIVSESVTDKVNTSTTQETSMGTYIAQ